MKSSIKFAFVAILLCSTIFAQDIYLSGSSQTKYGQGKGDYQFIENLSSLNMYWENFYIYLQYEYSNPPEFGLPYTGIRKRWLEYDGEVFWFRVGHLQTMWGRGLALNLFDDQLTDYDNTLDGFHFKYNKFDYFKSEIIGGKGKVRNIYTDIPSDRPNREDKFKLFGGRLEIANIIDPLRISFSYIWSENKSPFYIEAYNPGKIEIFDTLTTIQETPSFEISYSGSVIDFHFENVYRHIKPNPDFYEYEHFGKMDTVNFSGKKYTNSLYGSLNINLNMFSVMVDYKKYGFDITNPEERRLFSRRPGRMGAYLNPPTVYKELEWTLASRHAHIIDFNDEIGYQCELQFSPGDYLSLMVNYSKSSRNAAWSDTSSGMESIFQKEKIESIFPSSEEPFMPAWELIVGAEGWWNDLFYKLYFINNAMTKEYHDTPNQFTKRSLEKSKCFTMPGEIEYSLRKHGLAVAFEFQNYTVTKETIMPDFTTTDDPDDLATNVLETLEYSRLLQFKYSYSPVFSIGLIREISRQVEPVKGDTKNWDGVEVVLNITGNNQLTLFAGSERGGIRCSSGICVPVPAIEQGIRISLNSRF